MIYDIFSAHNGSWLIEATTSSESEARQAVESLRIVGKTVLIKRDGKRVNWRYTPRVLVHRGQSELCAAYDRHLQGK